MFDIAKHLGATTRAVEDSTHEGTPVKVVVASRTYPTYVKDLWQAVTDPERIPRWFARVFGDLRLGNPGPSLPVLQEVGRLPVAAGLKGA